MNCKQMYKELVISNYFTFGTDISYLPVDEELDFELFMPN